MYRLIGNLRRTGLAGICCGLALSLQAQIPFEFDYAPLRLTTEIPIEVRNSIAKISSEEADADVGNLGRDGERYYTLSNYALSQAMRSGDIFFDGEVTEYLATIADTLLRNEPELRAQITIYATRISIPNANAWRNGTIFFNLPLLSYLNSEAEVAFILAHEIAHIRRSHSLNQFRKVQEVDEAFRKTNESEKWLEVLRFSREQEMEADLLGIDLILDSPYDPAEAILALQHLQEIDRHTNGFFLDLPQAFGLDSLAILQECQCDSARVYRYIGQDLARDGDEENDQNKKSGGNQNDTVEEPQTEKEELDEDQYATHPSLASRITALSEKLDEVGEIEGRARFLHADSTFYQIRTRAYFEQIEKTYQQARYASSLYGALRMLESHPANQYLYEMIAQNLYWLAFYREQGPIKESFLMGHPDQSLTYGSLICGLNQLRKSDWEGLLGSFLTSGVERFPTSETLLVLQGQWAEMYEVEETARTAYQKYLELYPDGQRHLFVRNRLEQL